MWVRLARELASHKLLHLAQILDPDLEAAKGTPQVCIVIFTSCSKYSIIFTSIFTT
jgi:hypothetical protein